MHLHLDDFLPFAGWMRSYRRRFLKADLFAGLTVAVVALPQSMAYAMIAGLPVQYGLYASIAPTIIGCLWGSSAHLITGPTTAVSLVVLTTLSPLAAPGSAQYIELAFALALVVGLIQTALGLARLGALLNFVSHAVLLGFTAGAALLIAFKQVPAFLGLKLASSGVLVRHLYTVAANLHLTHGITLGLGLLTVAVIVALRKWRPAWPGTLLAMILVGTLVGGLDLDRRGVALVGAIPQRLPPLHLPDVAVWTRIGDLTSGGLAIAILGLVEAVSIAKAIADQTRQRININREFVGQGLANMAAAFCSGYPGSGSFTRSAVNFRSGARTPLSGIVSGLAVALTLLLAAPLASLLPLSALAGVLMVVACDMVRFADIARTVRATRADAAVLLITFTATLLLNIEFAIYAGVLLSIGMHLAATSHPRVAPVAPDRPGGRMAPAGDETGCPQMEIVAVEGSIFFGSAAFLLDAVQRRWRSRPERLDLIMRMHRVNTMDASGVHVLEILLDEIRARGGELYFAGTNHRVFEVLKNSGFLTHIGTSRVRRTTGAAIRQAMRENFCPAVCGRCGQLVFEECTALKRSDWEIFGPGTLPPDCRAPGGQGVQGGS